MDTKILQALKELAGQYDILPSLEERAEREGVQWERLVPEGYVIFTPLTKETLLIGHDHLPPRLVPARVAAAFEWESHHNLSPAHLRLRFHREALRMGGQRWPILRKLLASLARLWSRVRHSPDSEV